MKTKKQAAEIAAALINEYKDADCTLDYEKDYELLFAVRLAAQCTDERVNQVTPDLFKRFPTLEAFANAEVEDVEKYIHSCGFFRAKAKDIVECSKQLIAKHEGKVPASMEELVKLPGVGRKTANLILGDLYGVPGSVVVDTHCIRLSNRIGLVDDVKDPHKIEEILRKILPEDMTTQFCHCIVYHGRAVCDARKPFCEKCCIKEYCKTYKKSGH